MTPKEFENYLDDRVGQMMARNRVIKYVPRKKSFWERVKQWVKTRCSSGKQQIKSVKK